MVKSIVGIDVGGTKIDAGLVIGSKIKKTIKIPTSQNKKQFVKDIVSLIEQIKPKKVSAICIGVPGLLDENGVVTNVQEYSHENLLSPLHVVPKPIVQEVVECAVIHENIIVLHNHCRFSVEYVFSTNDEPKSVVVQSGEVVEVFTYISAQITQKPSGVHEIQALSKKKRSKNKLHSMMEVKKKGNSKTEYHFHVFESSIRE